MKDKLKIVLDTNVLLVSISSRSDYHWIFQKLLAGEFDICITNDILLEYEEIISQKFNTLVASDVVRVVLTLPNVYFANVFFEWRLIGADPDDHKVVDCAISANADFIVSNDKHFDVLKKTSFPVVEVLNVKKFKKLLDKRARTK